MNLNRNKTARISLVVLFIILLANIVYAAVPQSTVRTTGAGITTYVGHYLNGTLGWYQGTTQRLDAAGNAVFVTLDTGQGANELYDMDQNVLITSDVNFSSVEADQFFLNAVNKTDLWAYPQQPASYIIWKSGSTYYAKNGTDGRIQFQGADAATVIQDAINTLTTGGKIDIHGDMIHIAKTLNITYGSIHIEGEALYTVFWLENGADCDMIHVLDGAVMFGLSNIALSGNKNQQTIPTNGVVFEPGTNYDGHFNNVHIVDFSGSGIYTPDGTGTTMNHLTMSHVFIETCEVYGIYAEYVDHVKIVNSLIYHGEVGLYLNACRGWRITTSEFAKSTGDAGIVLEYNGTYPSRLNMQDCEIYDHQKHGLELRGATMCIIDGNTFERNGLDAHNTYSHIYVGGDGAGHQSTENQFNDNVFYSWGGVLPKYGYEEADNAQNYNELTDNVFKDGFGTAAVLKLGGFGLTHHNLGWRTENNVLSPAFAIDGVAVVTVTIPHGLAETPDLEDCQLTVVEDTDVDDWGYSFVKVESVGAVNVVAKVNVTVASATGGATAKLALHCIWEDNGM